MKIKLEKIYKSQQSFMWLEDADLSVKTSFKLSFLLKEIRDILSSFEHTLKDVRKKYGKLQKQADGRQEYVVTEPDKIQQAQKEMDDLLQEEVELKKHFFIKTSELPEKIKSKYLIDLDWLITE